MILDISDELFKDILNDKELYLHIRWDGDDFASTLDKLFNHYFKRLEIISNKKSNTFLHTHINLCKLQEVNGFIKKAVNYYLNGFPSKSYETFEMVMRILMQAPLRKYIDEL